MNNRFNKNKSNLVRISETTRETLDTNILKENNNNFNQWLAGLIDANGYLSITQKKYTNCEIIVELKDGKCLYLIQDKFGGSIKPRSGVNTLRYRLHSKESPPGGGFHR